MKYIKTYEYFNVDELSNLKTFKQRKDFVQSELVKTGMSTSKYPQGTARKIYPLKDNKVLKMAKNPKGIQQNLTEIEIGTDKEFSDVVSNVSKYDEKGNWLIAEKAIPMTEYKFEELLGYQADGFFYWLRFSDGELGKFYNKQTFALKIKKMIEKYDLDRFDVAQITSWGYIGNRVVLIDYGLTKHIARKYYKVDY
jgi:hypothetical protein